jgi:hypothetical protein
MQGAAPTLVRRRGYGRGQPIIRKGQIGVRKKCRHCHGSKRAAFQPIHPFRELA